MDELPESLVVRFGDDWTLLFFGLDVDLRNNPLQVERFRLPCIVQYSTDHTKLSSKRLILNLTASLCVHPSPKPVIDGLIRQHLIADDIHERSPPAMGFLVFPIVEVQVSA